MEKNILRTTWDGQPIVSPRNIYQELHRTLSIMEHPRTGRSQDDVPANKILLYTIKDYQRMLEENAKLKEKIEKKKKSWENNEILTKKNNKLSNKVAELENKLKERDAQIAEIRQNRDIIVRDVTEDLQEQLDATRKQLKEARQQIVAMAGVIASSGGDASQAVSIDLSRILHPEDDPEEREWMEKSLAHLDKVFLSLNVVENRLNMYLGIVKEGVEKYEEYSTFKDSMKKLNKAFGKLDSACAHIENFFEVVGEIKVKK